MKHLLLIPILFLNLAFAQTVTPAQRDSIERVNHLEQIEWLDDESEEMQELISIVEGKYRVTPTPDCDSLMEVSISMFNDFMAGMQKRNVTMDYYGRQTFFHKVSHRYGYFYELLYNKTTYGTYWLIECKYPLEK